MEKRDKDWSDSDGLNADGALYKMYKYLRNPGHATSGAEKKTRKTRTTRTCLTLYTRASVSRRGPAAIPLLTRRCRLSVVDFLAARCHHRGHRLLPQELLSLPRPAEAMSGRCWPWDVDLSFGRVWITARRDWDQHLIAQYTALHRRQQPPAAGHSAHSRAAAEYLRRILHAHDELLQGRVGTPAKSLYYEPRTDVLAAELTRMRP